MSAAENTRAGRGAVVLDIGGDVGAVVVWAPPAMEGAEVAIVPASTHRHHHDHGMPAGHPDVPLHAAVLGRLVAGRIVHCVVFGEVRQGTYELHVRPDGPVRVTASVVGGEVTEVTWPAEGEVVLGSADDLSRGTPGRR